MSHDAPEPGRQRTAPRIDRRHFLALLLSTTLSVLLARRGVAAPLDQGIGGTGYVPPADQSDRGIGGTGVIGTIKKFGSIFVNDLRISYAPDAVVRIDGQPASVSDLRIGQVVRVAASGPDGSLSTQAIDVTSEVVGPIETIQAKTLIVLGQTVVTSGLKTRGLKVGDVVAVSGLRRNDGTIVASLIERSPGASSRVAGPLIQGTDGTPKIGDLMVTGLDPALVGRRIVVDGTLTGDRFVASRATSEAALLPPSVRTVSIESYVERNGDSLRLGSGFAVNGADGLDVPAGRSVRAVVQTSLGVDGRLTIDSLRAGGRTYGGGRGHGGGRGPGPGGMPGRGNEPGGRGAGGSRGGGPGGGFGGPGSGFGNPGGGFGGPGGGFGGGGRFGGPGGGFGGGGFGGGGRH